MEAVEYKNGDPGSIYIVGNKSYEMGHLISINLTRYSTSKR